MKTSHPNHNDYQQEIMTANTEKDVEKEEHLVTVGESTNWSCYYGNKCGESF